MGSVSCTIRERECDEECAQDEEMFGRISRWRRRAASAPESGPPPRLLRVGPRPARRAARPRLRDAQDAAPVLRVGRRGARRRSVLSQLKHHTHTQTHTHTHTHTQSPPLSLPPSLFPLFISPSLYLFLHPLSMTLFSPSPSLSHSSQLASRCWVGVLSLL
jgi:hypothetical protein